MKLKLRKSTIAEATIWFGFCFIFPGAILFRPETIIFPMLAKSMLTCAAIFYANVYWLLPSYMFKSRYTHYLLGVVVAALVMLGVLYLLNPWRDSIYPADEGPFMFVWLMPIAGMLFVSTIYAYFRHNEKTHKRDLDLTHQNIEFEMKFLKSQINPHFLFNALNNIYALSVIKSEKTPEMILKLSDMLRFTLYDSDNKKVKLSREIEYIINFINFQKLKMDSEPNIKIDVANCNGELMIEPMLMIPFIENSFKHGNIDNAKKGWLQVEIKTLGPILIFKNKNSLPAVAMSKDSVGGIGVENVRKRLDMLYPGRYEFEIETTNNAFAVYMKIDTFAS